MFERFTPEARRTVVLAQDIARGLDHNYIGTEHILLALLALDRGIPVRVLVELGMTFPRARQEVIDIVGLGKQAPSGHIPFTPRAKKVLELSLREAVAVKSDHIGPEHLLLGLIQEGSGVAAQIMKSHVGDLLRIRFAVLDLLPSAPVGSGGPARWLRRRSAMVSRPSPAPEPGEPGPPSGSVDGGPGEQEELRTTPAADASLEEAARLAGSGRVGSHHLMLAALADPNAAAARTLAGLGLDLDLAREALRQADVSGTTDESPLDAGRRQLSVQVIDSGVVLRATDDELVGLARAALDVAGDQDTRTIHGHQPVSVSLATVWEALRDSLIDIRFRAGGSGEGVVDPGAAGGGTFRARGTSGSDGPDSGTGEPGAAAAGGTGG